MGERITNGTFASGLTGWDDSDNYGSGSYASVSSGICYLVASSTLTYSYQVLSQSVNWDAVSTLTFKLKRGATWYTAGGTNRFRVIIGGTEYYNITNPPSSQTEIQIDVSGITGTRLLEFRVQTSYANATAVVELDDVSAIYTETAPTINWVKANGGTADITIKPGATVTFTSDVDPGYPTPSFTWAFGSGEGSGSGQNTSHQYNNLGTFTVSLTVSNSAGSDVETKTAWITVSNAPGVGDKVLVILNETGYVAVKISS